jgi:hypothetical protein
MQLTQRQWDELIRQVERTATDVEYIKLNMVSTAQFVLYKYVVGLSLATGGGAVIATLLSVFGIVI